VLINEIIDLFSIRKGSFKNVDEKLLV